MSKQAEAGKGSKPRQQQDSDAFASGWDRIFGGNKQKEIKMNVIELLTKAAETVDPDLTVSTFVEEYLLDHDEAAWPLLGDVKQISLNKWTRVNASHATVDGYYLCVVNSIGGGDGGGEYVERIIAAYKLIEVSDDMVVFDTSDASFCKLTGFYCSHEGIDWDEGLETVSPSLKTIVEFK